MFIFLQFLLQDKKTEAMILVGPKAGISLITNIKTYNVRYYIFILFMVNSQVSYKNILKE